MSKAGFALEATKQAVPEHVLVFHISGNSFFLEYIH